MKAIDEKSVGYEFWKRVDALREQLGLTLSTLSDQVSLTYSTMRTQRSINTLPKTLQILEIAETLGATAEFLVTGKEPEVTIKDPVLLRVKENQEYYEAVSKLIKVPKHEFLGLANMIDICYTNHYPADPSKPQHA